MKGWMWGIAGTVVGSVLVLLITNFMTSHEEGSEALDRELIRTVAKEVMAEELTTDSGKTVGEVLTEMNGTLIRVETEVRLQREALNALTE